MILLALVVLFFVVTLVKGPGGADTGRCRSRSASDDATHVKPRKPRTGRDAAVAAACGVFVALMVGAAYAAVPFYDWFCRVTGFGGTHPGRDAAPAGVLDRSIAVRFDANVDGRAALEFEPEKTEINVRIGEVRHRLLHRRPIWPRGRRSGRRPTT